MSKLYEVSCEELDFLNDCAKEYGVTGSREMCIRDSYTIHCLISVKCDCSLITLCIQPIFQSFGICFYTKATGHYTIIFQTCLLYTSSVGRLSGISQLIFFLKKGCPHIIK